MLTPSRILVLDQPGKELMIADFDNGFSASVLTVDQGDGPESSVYEIAVLRNGKIVYDTPVTDNVVRVLGSTELKKVLVQIQELPEWKSQEQLWAEVQAARELAGDDDRVILDMAKREVEVVAQ